MITSATFRKTIIAASIAAAAVAAPSAAQAAAYAYSSATVAGLVVEGIPGFGGDFSFSAANTASLTGEATINNGDSDNGGPFSIDRGVMASNGPVDPLQAFVGNAAANPGENIFSPVGPTDASWARADHLMTDTLVNGGGLTFGTGDFTDGGDWSGVAESFVSGTGTSGLGNSANNQAWDFGVTGLAAGTTATIDFLLDVSLIAGLSPDESGAPASVAIADFSLTLGFEGVDGTATAGQTITGSIGATATANGGGDTVTITEDGISALGFATGASGTGVTIATFPGQEFRHITVTLPAVTIAGDYTFSITKSQSADTRSQVPEPATTALMGLGLLAFGAAARRRKVS